MNYDNTGEFSPAVTLTDILQREWKSLSELLTRHLIPTTVTSRDDDFRSGSEKVSQCRFKQFFSGQHHTQSDDHNLPC